MSSRELMRRPSPRTARILLALYEMGVADTRTLMDIVGIDHRIIWAQLNYWRRKGWVARDGPGWRLTELGREQVRRYRQILERAAKDG